jgi:hypothetical protein
LQQQATPSANDGGDEFSPEVVSFLRHSLREPAHLSRCLGCSLVGNLQRLIWQFGIISARLVVAKLKPAQDPFEFALPACF